MGCVICADGKGDTGGTVGYMPPSLMSELRLIVAQDPLIVGSNLEKDDHFDAIHMLYDDIEARRSLGYTCLGYSCQIKMFCLCTRMKQLFAFMFICCCVFVCFVLFFLLYNTAIGLSGSKESSLGQTTQ